MKTIIETATSNPEFTTLVTAIKTAGLLETLSGAGPFTVFAPTNAAFKKVPAETLKTIMADTVQLKALLLCHVVEGKKMSKDVVAMTEIATVQGKKAIISKTDGVVINTAKIVTPDIECSNGVIHAIDTVFPQ
jgi:uncharacterized surface protein with fasciclin (FAS1) repeats